MRRYLHTILLGAALIATLGLRADDHPKRYYDREHKDYHEWNDREQQSYQRYRDEKHIGNHEWQRAPKPEQRDYWKWRHEHPDGDRH
jgi:hypothetical protein